MKLFCSLLSVVLAKGKKGSTRPVLSASEGRSLGMPDGTCKNWVVPDYCCEPENSEFEENCRATTCYCDAYCCEAGDCCDDYDQGQCAAELGSCFQQTGSVDCPAGLEVNADETACIDIDECAIGTHNCDVSETCENSHASFVCNAPPTTTDLTTTTIATTTTMPEPCVGFEILPINIKTTWKRAKRICRLAGGELPNFDNENELNTFNTARAGDNRREWLGIRKVEHHYKSYGKTKVSFFEWAAGEPNNQGGNEKCVETWGSDKWNLENCESKQSISCKFEHVRYC